MNARPPHLLSATVLSWLSLSATAVSAHAAQLSVAPGCYRSVNGQEEPYQYYDPESQSTRQSRTQEIPTEVTGLAPGQPISVALYANGRRHSTRYEVVADASGTARRSIPVWKMVQTAVPGRKPSPAKHEIPIPDFGAEVVARDETTEAELARAPVTIGFYALAFPQTLEFPMRLHSWDADFDLIPRFFRPVTWLVSGFAAADRPLTAYYVNSQGRVFDSQRLGKPKGQCGYLKVRKTFAPADVPRRKWFKGWRYLRFMVQATDRYDKNAETLEGQIPYRQAFSKDEQIK